MKRCNACQEYFEDTFSYCPKDASVLEPINHLAKNTTDPDSFEFQLTFVDTRSLFERLTSELRFLLARAQLAWPDFRRQPLTFIQTTLIETTRSLLSSLSTPKALASTMTAIGFVFSVSLVLLILDGRSFWKPEATQSASEEDVQLVEFNLPDPEAPREGQGVGAGFEGRVGFSRGKGEGSAPEPKRSTGGGGGGKNEPSPAQKGIMPLPSEIPAPIPKFPPVRKLSLQAAGIDIDPALWARSPGSVYGDPRSTSIVPSHGPGQDGGMGTSRGTGIGEGVGPGVGPGEKGNIGGGPKGPGGGGIGGSTGNNDDPDRVYTNKDTTGKVRVLLKPEPQYTEEARKNQITGTVVLRVVFSRMGQVTNIRAVNGLPFGLTERAIAAARQIRFQPATRNGQSVNVYMQLEYNFNLY